MKIRAFVIFVVLLFAYLKLNRPAVDGRMQPKARAGVVAAVVAPQLEALAPLADRVGERLLDFQVVLDLSS